MPLASSAEAISVARLAAAAAAVRRGVVGMVGDQLPEEMQALWVLWMDGDLLVIFEGMDGKMKSDLVSASFRAKVAKWMQALEEFLSTEAKNPEHGTVARKPEHPMTSSTATGGNFPEHGTLARKQKCDNCNSSQLIYQEGCLTCKDCGSSKCG